MISPRLFSTCGTLFALIATTFAAENLDRGVTAFPAKDGGVYVGWRLLADDAAGTGFDVYRSDAGGGAARKLNQEPIKGSTNYVDRTATAGSAKAAYSVRAAGAPTRAAASDPVVLAERADVGGFVRIKLQGDYKPQKVGVADLDGDGKYDYLIKHPDFNVDPFAMGQGYWKPSPEPFKLEAYRHDGTFMWRYDMGPGIETGIWYSPIVVYDLDGDGKAEVYCKAGPQNPAEIVRHERGMVTGGPEFLVKLDGATGRELARVPWPDRSGIKDKGRDGELHVYNFISRNLLGVAYLDGKRPHLIVERGTYSLIKIRAFDPALKLVWSVDTQGDYAKFAGQGTHGMQVADVDGDGRDEVIIGSAALDHDGKPLWSTGRGHPDACYVGHMDPSRPGMQIYFGIEGRQARDGISLVDARTGETLWGYPAPTQHIHTSALVADIDPTRPGVEFYGGEANGSQFWVYDARGNRIGNKPMGGLSAVAAWWGDEPSKFIVAGRKMFRFKPPTAGEIAAIPPPAPMDLAAFIESLKQKGPAKVVVNELWPGYVGETFGRVEGSIVAIADCLGDWREELIVSLPGEIRIYSTTIPATSRRVCLMQDRQYRTSVARQTMGYLYPPMLGDGERP
jgi:rhamnogalacturonan endolyase